MANTQKNKSGLGFYDRGDVADNDKTLATLIADGTYHTWDLSGIISSGTKLVKIKGYCKSNSAGKEIIFRKNGNSNTINVAAVATQVANGFIDFELHVAPDANGVIEYKITAGGWIYINIVIAYWLAQ